MPRKIALIGLLAAFLAHPAEARYFHIPKAEGVPRDSRGRIARSPEARHQFMQANPCPGGPDKGSTSHCSGYVVDHLRALACGGADAPSNMQWQTEAEGKAKDKIERKGC